MRDEIRRRLSITPPIDRPADFPGAIAGQQPLNQRNPSNQLLDSCIRGAGAKINRRAKNGETNQPVVVSVTAQAANGPLEVQLDNSTPAFGQVDAPKHVWYTVTGDTSSTPLEWKSDEWMNSQYSRWMNEAPSTPRFCWTRGARLYVWPAPASAGTISFTARIGIFSALSDGDTVAQLPNDYLPCLIDCVVYEICAIQPNDEVYAARLPAARAEREESLGQICDWMNERNGNYVQGMVFTPYTVRRGRSR